MPTNRYDRGSKTSQVPQSVHASYPIGAIFSYTTSPKGLDALRAQGYPQESWILRAIRLLCRQETRRTCDAF